LSIMLPGRENIAAFFFVLSPKKSLSPSISTSSRILSFDKKFPLGLFKKSNYLLSGNGGETFQKIFDRFTGFKIINEGLHGNTGASENQRPSQYMNICMDHFRFHI